MSFPIHLAKSSALLRETCATLSHFGEPGHERVQITKTDLGYVPSLTALPSWIERILCFFGLKRRTLQLNEVADFALNWLRAHASQYIAEFHENIVQIQKLEPLMKKAHRDNDFTSLLASAKVNHLTQATPFVHQKEPPPAAFQFHWPQNFSLASELEHSIGTILSHFLSRPGTTIQRVKKTSTVILQSPTEKCVNYTLPIKVDFYLEGAISKRRIIVKTREVIGSGGQRKVLQAFDVLNGEELVSKPFANNIERLVVQTIHKKELVGFVPCAVIRGSRFYEKKCQTLNTYFTATPTVRLTLVCQLIMALHNLHSLSVTSPTYSHSTGTGRVTENIPDIEVYNGDIKPENILVFINEYNRPQAALSDLGTLCQIEAVPHTLFFRSPERTRFIEKECYSGFAQRSLFLTVETIMAHNRKYGQCSDVWSLGIVFTTLLSGGDVFPGSSLELGVPNLECFKKHLELAALNARYLGPPKRNPQDAWLLDLTQAEVDQSIDKLKAAGPKELYIAWDLVKLMLKVNPIERITAKEASEQVSSS